jgi:hypothetical protein
MSVWCSGRGGFARGGGHRFEPQQPWSIATLRGTGGWVAGWVALLSNFFCYLFPADSKTTVLAGTYVTRQHCGSGMAGGHSPAKIANSTGTRLLACVAPTSTNAF